MSPATPLTFNVVDDLGFAAMRGAITAAQQSAPFIPISLGPLLELLQLCASGLLPNPPGGTWLVKNGTGPMVSALRSERQYWINSEDHAMGFIRATRAGADGDSHLLAFLMEAKRAATDVARLPGSTPGQLVAAMEELESNIHEHSEAPTTGILAFRAVPGAFEFVAADRGIGILRSLRQCPIYAGIPNHGKALESALADGTSRFGPNGKRGYGFRPIFIGLVNLYSLLRFRSGDYALCMNGTSPALATSQVAQKPPIEGFLASLCCSHSTAHHGVDRTGES
jgi:hypothetical protein